MRLSAARIASTQGRDRLVRIYFFICPDKFALHTPRPPCPPVSRASSPASGAPPPCRPAGLPACLPFRLRKMQRPSSARCLTALRKIGCCKLRLQRAALLDNAVRCPAQKSFEGGGGWGSGWLRIRLTVLGPGTARSAESPKRVRKSCAGRPGAVRACERAHLSGRLRATACG